MDKDGRRRASYDKRVVRLVKTSVPRPTGLAAVFSLCVPGWARKEARVTWGDRFEVEVLPATDKYKEPSILFTRVGKEAKA